MVTVATTARGVAGVAVVGHVGCLLMVCGVVQWKWCERVAREWENASYGGVERVASASVSFVKVQVMLARAEAKSEE